MLRNASHGHHAASRLCVLVLGYVIRGPVGGLAWHHLQYVLGLKDLGHEVYFLEDSEDYPSCCNPVTGETSTDPAFGLTFARRIFAQLGLGEQWAYHDAHRGDWHGPCAGRIRAVCARADLVLNLSGMNPLRPWLLRVPVRVLVDTDPVFTQVRHLIHRERRQRARLHTHFFTFGEAYGSPGSEMPTDGLPWQPTRQPVVLRLWPRTAGPADGAFTTVMQWESYPPVTYAGSQYGLKSQSMAAFIDLPMRTRQPLELALAGSSAPRSVLAQQGWGLRHAGSVSRDPWQYRRYLQRSKAEFGIAKHGYVSARSGWFSERSANYLASGRPVLTQQTGFSAWLNADLGVVAFGTAQEALSGIETIASDYRRHCDAARAVAAAYFDAGAVLTSLLERSFAERKYRGAQRSERFRETKRVPIR